jgi:hypothetical protein
MFTWARREVENYLLHPAAIRRFVEQSAPLGPLATVPVNQSFERQMPKNFDPFDDGIVFLRDVKASDEFLLPLLGECGLSTSKNNLFLLAAAMLPEEVHPEVKDALDAIAGLVGPLIPAEVPVGGPEIDEGETAGKVRRG